MPTAKLTSKGQVTIAADVRRALHVEAGDRVESARIEPGRFEVVAATRSVRGLRGRCGKPPKAASIGFAAGGADLADCLTERIAHAQECMSTVSLDTGAARDGGTTLIA